jgi:hypothetical protein
MIGDGDCGETGEMTIGRGIEVLGENLPPPTMELFEPTSTWGTSPLIYCKLYI